MYTFKDLALSKMECFNRLYVMADDIIMPELVNLLHDSLLYGLLHQSGTVQVFRNYTLLDVKKYLHKGMNDESLYTVLDTACGILYDLENSRFDEFDSKLAANVLHEYHTYVEQYVNGLSDLSNERFEDKVLRIMKELNCPAENLDKVISLLPCSVKDLEDDILRLAVSSAIQVME